MPSLAISSTLGVILAILAAIIVIRGLWRATSVQKGTGCPVCDAHMGCSDDHDHDHDHDPKHDHDHKPKS